METSWSDEEFYEFFEPEEQLPIEEILRRNTRKATLETLRANGIILEDDLAELTDTQLEVMGINMVERRKVLAQTDSIRYCNNTGYIFKSFCLRICASFDTRVVKKTVT
jgi:hypothetical protein